MSFLLSTAVRSIRETGPLFNSMLIHVVRFTNVQEIVREEVERELEDIASRLQYGDGDRTPTLLDELKALWDDGLRRDRPMRSAGRESAAVECRLRPSAESGGDRGRSGRSTDPRWTRWITSSTAKPVSTSSPSAATSCRAG